MRRIATAAALILLLALALPACGAAEQPEAGTSKKGGVGLKRIGSFDSPVYVTDAPGFPKLLFVVEQPGRVEVLSGGRRAGTFLDLVNELTPSPQPC